MPSLSFKPYWIEKIKKGEKTQSIRPARCYSKTCIGVLGTLQEKTYRKPDCYPLCPGYKSRFGKGGTIYFFTGLRTRNCKRIGTAIVESVEVKRFKDLTEEDAKKDGFEDTLDILNNECSECCVRDICGSTRTAKRLTNLAERYGFIPASRSKLIESRMRSAICKCSALYKLQIFLVYHYDLTPETPFEIIRWRNFRCGNESETKTKTEQKRLF